MNPFREQSDRDDYSEKEITTMDKVKEWWGDFRYKLPLLFATLAVMTGESCGYGVYKNCINEFVQVNGCIATIAFVIGFIISMASR